MNPKTPQRTAAVVLLLAASLIVLAVPTTAHGEVASGPERHYATAAWDVDLAAMRTTIAHGQPVEVMLGNLGLQPLMLTEFSAFAPGAKKIVFIDENQSVIGEQDFNYWSYTGSVQGDPTSSAFIGMDDRGLYGFAIAFGTRYNFLPSDENHVLAEGESASIRVKWRESVPDEVRALMLPLPDASAPDIQDPTQPSSASSTPGSGGSSSTSANSGAAGKSTSSTGQTPAKTQTHTGGGGSSTSPSQDQTGQISPYADLRYRNAHSNYATRIANACGAQYSMWRAVNIYFTCYTVVAAPNYSDSSNCTTHLEAFKNTHYHGDTWVDAWQLFTGKDLSCQGNAYVSPAGTIVPRSIRDSVIEAVDHSNWDWYDPDEVSDLGLASGHEITHSWGEPDHPTGDENRPECGNIWCYNIMQNGVDPDNQGFWHKTSTKTRVRTATQGQF